jgi:hypothetical protein
MHAMRAATPCRLAGPIFRRPARGAVLVRASDKKTEEAKKAPPSAPSPSGGDPKSKTDVVLEVGKAQTHSGLMAMMAQ